MEQDTRNETGMSTEAGKKISPADYSRMKELAEKLNLASEAYYRS